MGYRKTKARQRSKTESIHFTDPEEESVRRPSTTPGKVGSFHGGGYALQDGNKEKLKVVGGRCKRDSKSCQRGIWVKSRARKKLILWKHKERKKVHFATRMDICHLKTRS